ncbi:TetR/AcrR family transcriptional regulator [Xylanibacillus composti]|uniref:TetR family transcriptional regulator n=1 Tax=Xylanibacillus composti TaxID=1572762 RepID=A0A8J4H3X8_9BACL|nr:TetR/AcrR family transcriptional regulator [Xylanibacillus composti]MDT9726238.1 TetR/AcrR family transcriptional regulator [Xylanibacillus composti]GIQ68088.1 TetR family transcriptional regulator [Xylanibacillus composti]
MSPRMGLTLPTIIQAAAEMADQEGFDAVTLASLASKLNIRTPSLYNHIDGLSGLHRELTLLGIDQLYRVMAEAAHKHHGADAIRAMSHAYVNYVRSRPGLYEATFRMPDFADADVQQTGNRTLELVVEKFQECGLEGEDAVHAVRGLRSLLHGFASLESKGGFGMPLDADESLRRLIDTFLLGIQHAVPK